MMFYFVYPTLDGGYIMSAVAYEKQECIERLLYCLGMPDVAQHGWGFWTRGGVYVGRIIPMEFGQRLNPEGTNSIGIIPA